MSRLDRVLAGLFAARVWPSSPLRRSGLPAPRPTDGPGPNLVIEVAGEANGTIVIDLLPDVAPSTSAQITALAARAPMTTWSSTA
jgi:peptidylprolyl isomerase